jgi:hypothetical protein
MYPNVFVVFGALMCISDVPHTSDYIRHIGNAPLHINHERFLSATQATSSQVHIHFGGPGEMVVAYVSADASTASEVMYGKDAKHLTMTATGTVATYSQMMCFLSEIWKPTMGAPTTSAQTILDLVKTTSWAYDPATGDHYSSWDNSTLADIASHEQFYYKNPATVYNSPFIHTVTLKDLKEGGDYFYKVPGGQPIRFRMPAGRGEDHHFVVFGCTAKLCSPVD